MRAGEDLAPYTVTETSDRMRDAMQQLTGLDKVGKVTLMDANAVQHITNRHAGGDGSADGTMKNSADVARAAYVLNNFDNAYLAKDRAKGYKDSRGKRAPIVIFEKKIDGSHIIVEAVCDTKKGQNFIVSEYLSSVGVDQNEVVKALQAPMDAASDPRHTSETFSAHSFTTTESVQSPMDAASDPRDTSETLAAHSSAATTVSQRAGDVNGKSVENADGTGSNAGDGRTGSAQRGRAEEQRTAGAAALEGERGRGEDAEPEYACGNCGRKPVCGGSFEPLPAGTDGGRDHL